MFSILCILVCGIINLQIPDDGFWSRFVIVGFITFWALFIIALKKRKNILKCLLYETVIISAFSVFWDFYTGMNGWSFDFVLPILFIAIIISMAILARVLKIGAEEHILYLVSLTMFGILPLIFIFNNMIRIKLPSMICIGISCILFSGLIVFEGKNMWNEFIRRLHI